MQCDKIKHTIHKCRTVPARPTAEAPDPTSGNAAYAHDRDTNKTASDFYYPRRISGLQSATPSGRAERVNRVAAQIHAFVANSPRLLPSRCRCGEHPEPEQTQLLHIRPPQPPQYNTMRQCLAIRTFPRYYERGGLYERATSLAAAAIEHQNVHDDALAAFRSSRM